MITSKIIYAYSGGMDELENYLSLMKI